jgi:nucleotide-binding universal stress UspA family protein
MVPSEYTEIEAKQTLDNVVAQAIERSAGELPDLVRTLEYGDPRGVLRRLGEEADLLVLGARGHRGVAHLLLGSVTTGLVHQPLITTIVIPSTHG